MTLESPTSHDVSSSKYFRRSWHYIQEKKLRRVRHYNIHLWIDPSHTSVVGLRILHNNLSQKRSLRRKLDKIQTLATSFGMIAELFEVGCVFHFLDFFGFWARNGAAWFLIWDQGSLMWFGKYFKNFRWTKKQTLSYYESKT